MGGGGCFLVKHLLRSGIRIARKKYYGNLDEKGYR